MPTLNAAFVSPAGTAGFYYKGWPANGDMFQNYHYSGGTYSTWDMDNNVDHPMPPKVGSESIFMLAVEKATGNTLYCGVENPTSGTGTVHVISNGGAPVTFTGSLFGYNQFNNIIQYLGQGKFGADVFNFGAPSKYAWAIIDTVAKTITDSGFRCNGAFTYDTVGNLWGAAAFGGPSTLLNPAGSGPNADVLASYSSAPPAGKSWGNSNFNAQNFSVRPLTDNTTSATSFQLFQGGTVTPFDPTTYTLAPYPGQGSTIASTGVAILGDGQLYITQLSYNSPDVTTAHMAFYPTGIIGTGGFNGSGPPPPTPNSTPYRPIITTQLTNFAHEISGNWG